MRKKIIISIATILSFTSIFFIYLSTYGIKTDNFNDYINDKVKEIDSKLSLDLQEVYLKLNLRQKSVKINTKNTKVYVEENFIEFSEIDINLDLIEFLRNNNSIKRIKLATKDNSINNITNFLNSYRFSLPRLLIYKQIKAGNIKLIANIYFDEQNKQDFKYEISGFVSNAELNLLNKNKLKNINFKFDIKDKIYNFENIKAKYQNINFQSNKISVVKVKEDFKINGSINNQKGLINPNIFSRIFNLNMDFLDTKKILLESNNDFSFTINSKRKIEDLIFDSKIKYNQIYFNKNFINLIYLKDGIIEASYNKKNFLADISGQYFFLDDKYSSDENKIKINIKKNQGKDINIKTSFKTKNTKINSKELRNYVKFDKKFFKDQFILFNSDNIIDFSLSNKNKITNLNLKSNLNFNKVKIDFLFAKVKKIVPEYNNFILLKNNSLELDYSKNKSKLKISGEYSLKDKYDNFQLDIFKEKSQINFESSFNINNNSLVIDQLNYKKKQNADAKIELSGNFTNNNFFNFKSINISEKNNKISITNLDLNKNYKIEDIDKIELNYLNENNKLNNLNLYKNKNNYELTSSYFDGSFFAKNLIEGKSKNNNLRMFKNLDAEISIKFEKVLIDNESELNDISGKIIVKNSKIYSGKINAFLNKNNKFLYNLKTNSNNEEVTNLYIENPEPFIKHYKFINGFKKGNLSYDSIKKSGISYSKLKIYDFKVKEVPILAKILTLASLQGIADLLTGEGIRFDEFDMDYQSNNRLTEIKEIYAIGPAISILMEGYIEKEKLTSLRGTLVPATTINKTISKIPLLGKILVGKKTGEGVFGVSFKIKGPKNNLKTTVNPIKTLTPRFITRTLKKLKVN